MMNKRRQIAGYFFVQWHKMCGGIFYISLLFAIVSGISGCAIPSSGISGVDSERVMSQEEVEIRRRAHIRLELAVNYFESGKTTVALDEVKQSLLTDPGYADAYNLRGLIYMRLNKNIQAEESFLRALKEQPNDFGVLHNYAWLLCQQEKYGEADLLFDRVLTSPTYTARGKTLMTQGLCRIRAGEKEQAEKSFIKAYELEPGNPIVAYNLSSLLLQRGELSRAQFYIRRLNNSDLADAASLWLGIKVERALGDSIALRQLASQLKRRFSDSREQILYERGAFNE
ncbi:MAG: type IV pilus biogenesis/stability protein PilW [Candidatus Obscuribacterales bacterium]|jgi:type IV pilus assembly protein PilF|nr:type IV pilus biogenesis/stability protein PilW [Candidatus Obscuribacterales bacterium]